MPIAREKLALYPGGSIKSPEWLAIRARIQERAGNCCEWCGVRNGALGIRLPRGEFCEVSEVYDPGDRIELLVLDSDGINIHQFKVFRIVCTTAHLDRGLADHGDDNLAFLCQQDHNRHDGPSRAINAAATRKARKPITLLDLMGAS
jgi:hypothetical protein